ncbi:hypothetical protein B0H17DRAFT_1213885 [Mycena rosella]|uniref:Uncharacterized protein n=1 Tax=Mycena rosella TaxID=1033263 RepID=A0AAD7CP62_MYCRO|nr:hypothetical protein B0H17DRAFT_1213885 [Mycena rosella]
MQFTWAFLAALISVAAAAPTKRQSDCPLQNLSGLTIVTSADSGAHTRWDVFVDANELVQPGDLGWFFRKSPSANEAFVAQVGSQSNLFTFSRKDTGAPIGVSGSQLVASSTSAATFKVTCSAGCDAFAGDNDLAADGCTFELTDGTNGVGQCASFAATNSAVALTPCDGSLGQSSKIFGA